MQIYAIPNHWAGLWLVCIGSALSRCHRQFIFEFFFGRRLRGKWISIYSTSQLSQLNSDKRMELETKSSRRYRSEYKVKKFLSCFLSFRCPNYSATDVILHEGWNIRRLGWSSNWTRKCWHWEIDLLYYHVDFLYDCKYIAGLLLFLSSQLITKRKSSDFD